MSKSFELNSIFSIKENKLLTHELKASGAKRTLAVIVYRLGILYYLEKALEVKLPIILDSPASQEMDEKNLSLLIRMLKLYFKNSQIIIATNQKVNSQDINKKLK